MKDWHRKIRERFYTVDRTRKFLVDERIWHFAGTEIWTCLYHPVNRVGQICCESKKGLIKEVWCINVQLGWQEVVKFRSFVFFVIPHLSFRYGYFLTCQKSALWSHFSWRLTRTLKLFSRSIIGLFSSLLLNFNHESIFSWQMI